MDSFVELFSKKAKARGLDRLHFHVEEMEKRNLSVFNGEAQRSGASRETLFFVEGKYKDFAGSAYAANPREEIIEKLIESIIQTASWNKAPYLGKPIHALEPPRNNVADFESGRLARTLLDAEKFARDQAPKTEAFTVEVSQKTRTVTLFDCDGAGRRMSDIVGFFSLDVGVMAKNDGQAQTAHHHELFLRDDLDYKEIAARVAREASGMLNSGACASGRYKAVIRNSAFAELFGAFLPSFFAEKCQNKMSFLTGMLNSPIGSRAFSAYEDPAGLIRRRFDDEGTLTERKTIVDKGRLSDYFHNARTAALDPGKRKSNGNGFRQNYNEGISSAYTNVVVEGAQKTLAGLLSGMDEGLLVTECDGIFAGINPASGDFSVLAKGYMVKGGGLSRPVSGITIGGNLVDLLSAVEETGSDYIVIQSNTGVVKSPSARLSGIVVTGA